VKVATPVRKTIPVTVDYTGQTVGSETVEIRARVEGYLKSIPFTEGSFVKPGDLLYEIDKDKAQEVVEQAQGERNVAVADLEKADADVARYKPLVEQNAISREEYETSVSAAKAAKARLEAKEAALRRAQINMGYATVTAPVEGLVGKTEVDVGNLVGRGEPTLLTTISKIDPISVEIRVPETDILQYQRKRQAGSAQAVADLTLFFSDGSEHPQKGKVSMIDRNVDAKTGTLLVRVDFPNPDRSVRPGQFARVQGVREMLVDALLVPQSAVQELQGGFRLLIVDAENVARVRTVKAGARKGKLWLISEGLEADDRVIVEGRQKVKDGVRVSPIEMTIDENGEMKEATPPADGTPPDGKPTGDQPGSGGR
jgi:RND family efflux transporter MFP subunit